MNRPISSFLSEGVWTSSHSFHYETAYVFLGDFKNHLAELAAEEGRLQAEYHSDEDFQNIIHHETEAIRRSCFRSASAAVLFACMSLEAFLNYYGVRRLGQNYYKRFVERLGVTEKIACIRSISSSILLEPDDDLVVRSRRLFDARNALAHPKTREILSGQLGEFVSKPPSEFPTQKHFDDLEFCIHILCSTDTSIDREFEFPKRNI